MQKEFRVQTRNSFLAYITFLYCFLYISGSDFRLLRLLRFLSYLNLADFLRTNFLANCGNEIRQRLLTLIT